MKKQLRKLDYQSEVTIREATESEPRKLVGLIPYNKPSVDMGFIEIITPTAFDKTLSDRADVKALVSHDSSKVLGSVKAGTLRLTSTPDGLLAEVDLPNTTFANDVWETVRRGDVTTMSFSFYPINERTEIQNGKEVYYLTEVRLLEVSFAVAWPAYEDTTSMARAVRGVDIDKLETVLAKETIETDDLAVVRDTIGKLRALLEPGEQPTTKAAESTLAGDLLASLYDASQKL
jgi:hypothetical protein